MLERLINQTKIRRIEPSDRWSGQISTIRGGYFRPISNCDSSQLYPLRSGKSQAARAMRLMARRCSTINSSIRYCALRPAPQLPKYRQAVGLSESCPKIGDVPKSPFPSVAALVPSAGTITTPELQSARVSARLSCLRALLSARVSLIERQKPCKFLQSSKENR